MPETLEKMLTVPELIERLKTIGMPASRSTINKWRELDPPVPHYRPSGGKGDIYFRWSEVDTWLNRTRIGCFTVAPGEVTAGRGAA